MNDQKLEQIATVYPESDVVFQYKDGAELIDFDKASEGQRSAALISMLLQQEGGPLIIDQPESDLDNRIIIALINEIHSAKSKRQIIFASHNANFVVNGSSEFVGCLGPNRKFDNSGAIDKKEIRNDIIEILDGGKNAFNDRKNKYGF